MTPFETPVLFLVFNRPDHTTKVFEKIRQVKPKYLFVAADGPRESRPEEKEKCKKVRELILNGIDWDCELKTLFRDENLGCGVAVSDAITWFFSHVEQGIILEDDCVPNNAFFTFSERLLNYYRDDSRIMHIGGSCYVPSTYFEKESYYFSKYEHCWGWATWRRSWEKFDFQMTGLEYFSDMARQLGLKYDESIYWEKVYNLTIDKNDIWDYQWNYSIWKNRGICIHPTHNYIKNIGFDKDATHTTGENEFYDKIQQEDFLGEIMHPEELKINKKADKYVYDHYYNPNPAFIQRVFNQTKAFLKLLMNYI